MPIRAICFSPITLAMMIVVAGCLYIPNTDNNSQMSEYLVLNLEHPNQKTVFMLSPPETGWDDNYKTKMMVFKLINPEECLANSRCDKRAPKESAQMASIENGFYIGVFEVTRKQWEMVCGGVPDADPTYMYSPQWQTKQLDWETRPVVAALCDVWNVTSVYYADGHVDDRPAEWSFFSKLRKMFPDMEIALPTEDEWEYACRAGTDASYAVTDANGERLGYFGYFQDAPKVGTYPPNKWGLHDMNGSVAEWCSTMDEYGANVVRGKDTCSSRTTCHRGMYGAVHYGVRVKLRLRQ